MGEAQGLSFLGRDPLAPAAQRARPRPPPPRRGPRLSEAPFGGREAWNVVVFFPGFPLAARSVCLTRGGGVGALCADSPFPPGCWSRGSRGGAPRRRGSPEAAGRPFWGKHPWSAASPPGKVCWRCPGGAVGGRGVSVCRCWKLRGLEPVAYAETLAPRGRRGAPDPVVWIISLLLKVASPTPGGTFSKHCSPTLRFLPVICPLRP